MTADSKLSKLSKHHDSLLSSNQKLHSYHRGTHACELCRLKERVPFKFKHRLRMNHGEQSMSCHPSFSHTNFFHVPFCITWSRWPRFHMPLPHNAFWCPWLTGQPSLKHLELMCTGFRPTCLIITHGQLLWWRLGTKNMFFHRGATLSLFSVKVVHVTLMTLISTHLAFFLLWKVQYVVWHHLFKSSGTEADVQILCVLVRQQRVHGVSGWVGKGEDKKSISDEMDMRSGC